MPATRVLCVPVETDRGAALVLAVVRDGHLLQRKVVRRAQCPGSRGQATVEAVALWLIIGAIAAALLLALPRLGPLVAGALAGGSAPAGRREPAAAALADRALAGRPGRGGTPTLLAAERLLALELGADGARSYLAARLLALHGARLGHDIDVTPLLGGAEAPGDRLIASPAAKPAT